MDIEFKSKSLQKACNNWDKLVKKYGERRAKLIKRRLDDLRAATNLEEMRFLPGRCHELAGKLSGKLAIDLDHPYRLIFIPSINPTPKKSDGGLDWKKVIEIKILDIQDYHRR